MFYIMVLESNQQEREKLEHYFSQSPFAHETNLLFVSSYEEMNEHLKDHLVFDAFFIDVDGADVDVNISQSLSFTLGTVKNLMLGEVNPPDCYHDQLRTKSRGVFKAAQYYGVAKTIQ